jgi:hypothetical protein
MGKAIIFASDNHATNNQKNEHMKMKNLLLVIIATLGLTALTMAQNVPNYVPTNGLIGWWPFNGNANDESGNGNDGYNYLFNGLTFYLNPSPSNSYGVDRIGNSESALSTNIYGSNVMLPINNFLFQSDFTISIWAKNDSLLEQYPTILESGNNHLTMQYGNTGGPISFGAYLTEIGIPPFGGVGSLAPPLDWLQITLVNKNYKNKLYFNGNLVDSTNDFNSQQAQSDWLYLRVGNGNQLPQGSFYGLVDDIAIYNRALSQEEITALYTGEPVNPSTACNPLPSNLQNGLVGYWPFCGNANDESGNGNDGTVNGSTLSEDRFGAMGKAYDFDGMDDLIETTLTNIQSQNYTISCWYNSLLNIQGDQEISLVVSRDSPYATNGLYIYFIGGQPHYYFDRSRCYLSNTLISDTINLNNGTWNNYVAIFNNGFMSIYSNGILVDTLSTSEPLCVNGNFVFGNDNILPNRFFKGSLDDIGIWNRALSAEEVQQLYTINACTFTIYDTLTVNNYITIYDTVSVSTTDTLIINTLITSVQPAQENTFLVYPNPANSHITIDYGNFAIMNGYQLKIENSLGQQLFQTNITQQTDYLSLNNWGGNGLYFVHIIDAQGNTIDIRKIVLQ